MVVLGCLAEVKCLCSGWWDGVVAAARCAIAEMEAVSFGDAESELLDCVDLWCWCCVGESKIFT